ncbi:sulfatase-like hydrolase/transferase [Paraglaciecola sp. L3A3]|uniref:sulfatase-like hydrolase/transferase n=1 Tax=Paraglaciecola sp. L3A3 TaxID=2686358 RepID=UPI00131B3275|nr:sulfatase-like hydrolase/transferase [Paraglaciecola sp. L3A3]
MKILLPICCFLLSLCSFHLQATPTQKPNVLLVIADDMGLDASACYQVGTQQASMPNLEQLCAIGMTFNHAYAAPTCSPTRATILTGNYGFRTGVGFAMSRKQDSISNQQESLFELVSQQGYSSALVGKWHLATEKDGLNQPAKFGINEYFGPYRGGVKDYETWSAVHNGQEKNITGYATSVLTDYAIDWLSKQTKPWFLWLAYNAPHVPFHLPPKELLTVDKLPANDARAIKQNPLPYFNAALQALDTEMGRLLASLSANERQNTVVIFVGDNGSPGQVARKLYKNRGAKGSIFDGGTRVPLIVQGPKIQQGKSNVLVNSTDLYATIASITGAKSKALDSIDFSPSFSGQAVPRKHIYVEQFSSGKSNKKGPTFGWAVRDSQYSLVVPEGERQMLFDLTKDPLQQEDLLSTAQSSSFEKLTKELLLIKQQLKTDNR